MFDQTGRKLEFKLISLFAPKKSNWAAAIKQELSISGTFHVSLCPGRDQHTTVWKDDSTHPFPKSQIRFHTIILG